ncbi:MAG: polymerase sigma-70 factor [Verrucomicrobiaceae bacterium]|nr:polymerase sigma-70 factor [Verrucomicrobiaceae bacterium]
MASLSEEGSNASFPETRWTVVLALRHGGDTTLGHRALAELCRIYWSPLYGYARRLGNNPEDAEDLTQGFMEHVVKTEMLATADESIGKMRSFLRKSFSNYIHNNHRAAVAKMRGGDVISVRLETLRPVELELEHNAIDNASPDALYDRLCALALVEESLAHLEAEHRTTAKAVQFAAFKQFLDPQGMETVPQEVLAERLGMTLSNVRTTLFRLRQRFRELLRALVKDTLQNPSEEEINEELKSMRAALLR